MMAQQPFRLTLAQLNPTVGAIAGQCGAGQSEAWDAGRAAGAQMVALTEMFMTGYQTQDLILKPAFTWTDGGDGSGCGFGGRSCRWPGLGHRRAAC